MVDYQTLYLHLFNAVTDALRAMSKNDCLIAYKLLIQAQQECEEFYMTTGNE